MKTKTKPAQQATKILIDHTTLNKVFAKWIKEHRADPTTNDTQMAIDTLSPTDAGKLFASYFLELVAKVNK